MCVCAYPFLEKQSNKGKNLATIQCLSWRKGRSSNRYQRLQHLTTWNTNFRRSENPSTHRLPILWNCWSNQASPGIPEEDAFSSAGFWHSKVFLYVLMCFYCMRFNTNMIYDTFSYAFYDVLCVSMRSRMFSRYVFCFFCNRKIFIARPGRPGPWRGQRPTCKAQRSPSWGMKKQAAYRAYRAYRLWRHCTCDRNIQI